MKPLFALLATLLICRTVCAQQSEIAAMAKITEDRSTDTPPEYPGGVNAFGKYINTNLKYPAIAQLVGINGRLMISFVIDKNGHVIKVAPKNCIGAGCEAEAVKLFESSPDWSPGIQNGRAVSVIYTVPINFTSDLKKVLLKDLRKSDYGFVFNIKGTLYTIDEAEAIFGDSFMSDQVQIAEPFFNYNKIQKFDIPNKKEVYLIIFRTS